MKSDLREAGQFANACGAITVTKRGALHSLLKKLFFKFYLKSQLDSTMPMRREGKGCLGFGGLILVIYNH